MRIAFPDDYRRQVVIHGEAAGIESLTTWLRGSGKPGIEAKRRISSSRSKSGFDELLSLSRASDDGTPMRLHVPLLTGWPLEGPVRPVMGETFDASSATVRILEDLLLARPPVADVDDPSAVSDRSAALDLAALVVCDHPGDEHELVHEDGTHRIEIVADRLTGLPEMTVIDRYYSDDDLETESLVTDTDLHEICRRHVLHLRLWSGTGRDGARLFGLSRIGSDEPAIHAVVMGMTECMRIVMSIRSPAPVVSDEVGRDE